MIKPVYLFKRGVSEDIHALEAGGVQKSFYGKAYVVDRGDDGAILYSYNTPVAYRLPSGRILRLWGGWSATTSKHIQAFNGGRYIPKREWEGLPVYTVTYSSTPWVEGWGVWGREEDVC